MASHSRKQAIKRRRIFLSVCALVFVLIIALFVLLISSLKGSKNSNGKTDVSSSDISQSEVEKGESKPKTEPKAEPKLVSSATIINTGDIMVHSTQLDGAEKSDGSYDFSDFFKNISSIVSKADLAVANLEVTFGGSESGKYSGYPAFNTPDSLADVIKNAGFDLLLTTNNHSYDTGLFGLKRTQEILNQKGFSHIGTRLSASENQYAVKDINGIKIGMTAFSYENKCDTVGRKSLNGNIIATEANDLINTFNYDRLDEFYKNAENIINNCKKQKADKIIFYMHWGEEYQLKENTWQDTIAQKLCDLGVDIIVGSHPHVIQPAALLHSADSQNTAAVFYSMGNCISNQRQEIMHPECTTGHTEDGMLLSFKFDKYSDGSVALSEVNIIPTWVNKYKGGSGYLYSVIPLTTPTDGSNFGLEGSALSKSQNSYNRTKEIVKAGLNEIQDSIGCKKTFED